jgi:hypothetical protein
VANDDRAHAVAIWLVGLGLDGGCGPGPIS